VGACQRCAYFKLPAAGCGMRLDKRGPGRSTGKKNPLISDETMLSLEACTYLPQGVLVRLRPGWRKVSVAVFSRWVRAVVFLVPNPCDLRRVQRTVLGARAASAVARGTQRKAARGVC